MPAHAPPFTTRGSLALLGVAAVGLLLWYLPGETRPTTEGASLAADQAETVKLQLRIVDEVSGLTLTAERRVAKGTPALEAMEATVALTKKESASLKAVFITSLCGVSPGEGRYWGLAVDGERAKVGIGGIRLEQDTHLEWQTQKVMTE